MSFIDVVEWETKDNSVYAYKFPNSNLSTATQLIVRESQEAVLFSKGKLMGKFGPGKHKLTTENLPFLRNFYGIPFGGVNPFIAEVWFVNKTSALNIDWKTTTMRFIDPDYNQMVPLIASGRYGLKVTDAEKFLVQLVGTLTSFTAEQLSNHFMGALIAKTNSAIMAYMNTNQIGFSKISMYLDELSRFIKNPMSEFWGDYGFELSGFYITSVNIDESTTEGQKIVEALSQRSAQGIAGYSWQQQQAFNVMDSAAKSGTSMGILGMAMMTGQISRGADFGLSGNIMTTPNQDVVQSKNGFLRKETFCSKCGNKYPTTSKFCPQCGDVYNPCPMCGADNDENISVCVVCGARMKQEDSDNLTCPKCKGQIKIGTKFCPNCGNKL